MSANIQNLQLYVYNLRMEFGFAGIVNIQGSEFLRIVVNGFEQKFNWGLCNSYTLVTSLGFTSRLLVQFDKNLKLL